MLRGPCALLPFGNLEHFGTASYKIFFDYHSLFGNKYGVLGVKGPDHARELVKSAGR
jgi:hypothetical protein